MRGDIRIYQNRYARFHPKKKESEEKNFQRKYPIRVEIH